VGFPPGAIEAGLNDSVTRMHRQHSIGRSCSRQFPRRQLDDSDRSFR
jgi:hypothetical protein